MKSRLPAEAYSCESWFEKEQQHLFGKLWQFIAPKMLLSVNHAFVRRRIAGRDIVVQNFNGQLRAFDNVCPHRLTPLQNEDQGVKPLVCPYHAWRFDENGHAMSIPFHECYRLDDEERAEARLGRVHLYKFGQLVFVNVSPEPIAFEQQFSLADLESLRAASMLFDDEVLVTRFETRFNWKLAYENLRDALHPRFVHTSTLYKQVKFETRIDDAELADTRRYLANGSKDVNEHLQRLRQFSNGGLNEPMPELQHYQWHNYVERFGQDDWYLNWLMYPNLHIASGSAGYSFIIEHHLPVSAGRTDLMVYYVTGRKKRPYPTSAAVLLSHLQGAEKVLREDIEIMERVQSSMRPGVRHATTGDFEYQNMAIERWYLDVMEGRHAL